MPSIRWSIVLLVALSLAASCARERSSRRELRAPLGPSGPDAEPAPPVLIEPEPTPQFSIRVGGAATAGGTGMGHWPWVIAEPTPPPPPTDLELHRAAIVIDTHVDTPQAMADDGYDLLERHTSGHLDVPRMREGGLDAAFFSIWVNPHEYRADQAFNRALRLFEVVHEVEWRSGEVVVADRAAEVRQAAAEDRFALLMGVEGAHALGTDDEEEGLERLRLFRELGARYMTITWMNDNMYGHSSGGDHPERGLTDAGRRLIAEMERIGMVVDVSHVSDQTFWDIMEVATHPVMASHSSARALADTPRNMTDDMIRAVAQQGGVVCVNYYTGYIDRAYADALDRLEEAHPEVFAAIEEAHLPYLERGAAYRAAALELEPDLPLPDVGTVADHVMHVIDVGGVAAACLGSDFDGVPDLPVGLEDVTGLPALTAELRHRGLSDHALVNVLGGNVLRVLEANEPSPFGTVSARHSPGTGLGTGGGTGLGTGAPR